ncbi:hypothetical protein CR513_16690, partial [Mucuna pruriens]
MVDGSDFVNMATESDFFDSMILWLMFFDFANMVIVSNFADLTNYECMCNRGPEVEEVTKVESTLDSQVHARTAETTLDSRLHTRQSTPHSDSLDHTWTAECTLKKLIPLLAADKPPPPPSPTTGLKPLLEHLKYAYQEDDQKLPIIIANNL